MQDLETLKQELGNMAAQPDSPERFSQAVHSLASALMRIFALEDTEVAIFLSNSEKTFLSFAYPPYLVDAGIIPVTSADAVVAQIFRMGRPVIENNFMQQKHLSIFETVKAPGKTINPICKMLGVLLGEGTERIGVIQLSRRAPSFMDAGPDFSPMDLERLKQVAREVTPYLIRLIPHDFRGKLS
ncbi:MAG: GAF domain-containing protein [Acidobacteriota bacterium]|jgi:hypothetical protein|nr:GAF domain-containing protein [Acidobacteriota bacterium]